MSSPTTSPLSVSDPQESPEVIHLQRLFGSTTDIRTLRFVLEAHDNNVELAADYMMQETLSLSTRSEGGSSGINEIRWEGIMNGEMSEAEVCGMINNVKEIAVPMLRERLEGMGISDVEGESEKYVYGMSGMVVEEFRVTEEGVDVEVVDGGEGVVVRVRGVDVGVRVGRWMYERRRLLRVGDCGDGVVRVGDVGVVVRIGGLRGVVRVEEVQVVVGGDVRLRVGGCRLAVVYNTVARVLLPVLKGRLEREVGVAVKGILEEQLQEWSAWAMQ